MRKAVFVVQAKPRGFSHEHSILIVIPELGVFDNVQEANARSAAGLAGDVFKKVPMPYSDRNKFKLTASAESFKTLYRLLGERK